MLIVIQWTNWNSTQYSSYSTEWKRRNRKTLFNASFKCKFSETEFSECSKPQTLQSQKFKQTQTNEQIKVAN